MRIDRNNYQIGLYLDKALQHKNLTTKDLSKLTGIDASMLRKYIINELSPSLTSIKTIASALDMDYEYFINDSYYKKKQTKTSIDNELFDMIDETNEINMRKAYKGINRIINQSYNSASTAGKKEILEYLYHVMTIDIYKVIYNEKNESNSNRGGTKHHGNR